MSFHFETNFSVRLSSYAPAVIGGGRRLFHEYRSITVVIGIVVGPPPERTRCVYAQASLKFPKSESETMRVWTADARPISYGIFISSTFDRRDFRAEGIEPAFAAPTNEDCKVFDDVYLDRI